MASFPPTCASLHAAPARAVHRRTVTFSPVTCLAGVVAVGFAALVSTSYAVELPYAGSDLRLWLRADGVLDLDPGVYLNRVLTWYDFTGVGGNTVASDGIGPSGNRSLWVGDAINGRPAVRFDAGRRRINGTEALLSNGTAARTVFVVARRASGGHSEGVLIDLTGNAASVSSGGEYAVTQEFGLRAAGGNRLYTPALSTSAFQILMMQTPANGNTNNTVAAVNGNPRSPTSTNPIALNTDLSPWRVGGTERLSHGREFRGDIAEILVFEAELSEQELGAIGSYLRQKYGLGGAYAPGPSEVFFDNQGIYTDGRWMHDGNWNTAVRPAANQDAYIGDGLTATIDAPGAVAKDVWVGHDAATLPGDGTLTIDGAGASLTAAGLRIGTGGAAGTVHFTSGTMTLTGMAGEQALYAGQDNLSPGTFIMGTPGGNDAHTTLTYSGGRFEVAKNAGAHGTFILHSGTVSGNQNFIVGQGDGMAEVFIHGGSLSTTVDMNSNNGQNIFTQTGGLVSVGRDLQMSSQGAGSTTIDLTGGILRVGRHLNDRAGTSTINLGGTGRLEILGDSTTRAVKYFNHTGSGVLQLDLVGSSGPSAPLHVKEQADFAGTPAIELVDEIPLNAATTADWVGGTGNWDTHANWSGGAIPAYGANTIGTGSTITVITSANDMTGAGALVAASPGWDIDTIDPKAVKMVRTGDPLGGVATARISGISAVVTRDADLRIAPENGADAAGLNLADGAALTLSGTSRLIVGGGTQGTVDHDGTLVVGGDLLFGGGGLQGGTYNLNGGSLTVLGSIIEGDSGAPDAAVDRAQLQINGGTLTVAGDIIVQRFSLGEAAGSDGASYTIPAGQNVYSTGTTSVGSGGTNASLVVNGTLTADGASHVAERANASGTLTINAGASAEFTSGTAFRVAHGTNAVGAMEILGGTFTGRGVELASGAGSQAHVTIEGGSFTATGGLTLAPNATGTATLTIHDGAVLTVSGGNLETAHRGKGTVVMHGGTFNQDSNNIIVGQYAGSDATLEMYGGTINIGGNGQLRVTNRKDVTGRFLMYGGTVNVGGQMDTFNAADAGTAGSALIVVDDTHAESNAPAVLNVGTNLVLGNVATDGDTQMDLVSGTVNVGGSLELSRGAGNQATFNLSGGTLDMGGGSIVATEADGSQFVFTGGRLQNLGLFTGPGTQFITPDRSGTGSGQDGLLASNEPLGEMTFGNLVAGKFGRALAFDGDNDYVNVGPNTVLGGNNIVPVFSLSMWFNREADLSPGNATNHDVSNVLVAHSADSGNDHFEVGSGGADLQTYVDMNVGTDYEGPVSFPSGVQNGTWHHLAVTFDATRTSDEVHYWLDGQKEILNVGDGAGLAASPAELTLGIARIDGSRWGDFQGRIDDFGLWGRVLTDGEIAALYNGGAGAAIDSLANWQVDLDVYLPMDEVGWTITTPVDLIQRGGTLAPGASAGVSAIAGNYHLQEPAVLEIELFGAGGVPGVDFTFVDVAGTATLDGWIDVVWDPDGPFGFGDTFLVLRASEILGEPQMFGGFPPFEAVILQNYLGGGFDVLQLTLVPEPGALLLALIGLAAVLLGRRRCRHTCRNA